MLQLPGKKTAFVFSDPAGARACIALSKIYKQLYGHPSELFCNNRYDSIVTDDVHKVQAAPDFRSYNVDCVFTGTSHPNSSNFFEINSIKKAKKQNIYTISFIDHWVNFKLRFIDSSKRSVYPDKIWIIDDRAKQLAIQEGLPEDLLEICNNPHLAYLKLFWKPSFQKRAYLRELNITGDGTVILFVPDPLSIRDGKAVVGFTEDEAFSQLCNVLSRIKRKFHLVVKCHPLQPMKVLEQIPKKYNLPASIISSGDTLELINASDLVIGFYSNALLEADTMGKKVLRYFPGEEASDLLRHKDTLEVVRTENTLLTSLKKYIDG